MPSGLTRRQLLSAGLALGVGFEVDLHRKLQAQTPPNSEEYEAMHLELTGDIRPVHDPVIIKEDDTYYVYCTGLGIPMRSSPDMLDWSRTTPSVVFVNMPAWAREKIPGQTDIWAPDISFYNGKYHLYYAVSSFGYNRSVIVLATNATLNLASAEYEWVDEGLVVESFETNNYNCIDPNFVMDADGVPWLAFGSFWSGIKMRRLDIETGKPSEQDDTLYSLARRTENHGSVEAPFIIRRGDYYYLFVSFDFCCRGKDSTYRVIVGRSESVTGPYLDRDGKGMLAGGGTQVTFPTERYRGPGHNAVYEEDGIYYIVYHAYDTERIDAPTLRIAPLTWDADGWLSI